MRLGIFIMLILLFLAELSIADTVLNWNTKPFIIYIVILLITLFGIWKTKPKEHENI